MDTSLPAPARSRSPGEMCPCNRIPVGIGEYGAGVQLRFVLHQTIQDERRFSQSAGNGLLMQAHRVLAGVGVERDATAMQEMAEVSGQNVDWDIEAHAIR